MQMVLVLLAALLSPVLGLLLLLWLARLEETLPSAVDAARRQPAPHPVLAIPVRTVAPVAAPAARQVVEPTRVPVQRPLPAPELAGQPAGGG